MHLFVAIWFVLLGWIFFASFPDASYQENWGMMSPLIVCSKASRYGRSQKRKITNMLRILKNYGRTNPKITILSRKTMNWKLCIFLTGLLRPVRHFIWWIVWFILLIWILFCTLRNASYNSIRLRRKDPLLVLKKRFAKARLAKYRIWRNCHKQNLSINN